MVKAAVLAALVASPAFSYAAGLEPLLIQVTAVRATDSGPSDPELVALRPRLRRLGVNYRAFQIVNRESRPCDWRNEMMFNLPGDRRLQLLPKAMVNDVVKMQVRLLEGRRRLVDTKVGVANGGTMMFGVGRDRHLGDDALIILLKAETK